MTRILLALTAIGMLFGAMPAAQAQIIVRTGPVYHHPHHPRHHWHHRAFRHGHWHYW